ncbi:MAG TPA: acetylornithine deacetylase, partial [Thermoanaerobaculia bacterium]|nr:acetylornithine deacetylase [Thermoanaerobaculia bacterium]
MASLSDVDLLARLVAFDTTSRNSNLPLARFLADYLDRPGVEVTELPSPDGEKANLLVRVGPPLDGRLDPGPEGGAGPDGRPGLVLSGHMDVVPADDRDLWETDPFRLADRGDRLAARGACDMKGFLALAANLAAEAAPERLRAPLVLVLTYDEEVGCLGSGELVRAWRAAGGDAPALPRAAVIGEPTELRVVRHHKGHLKMRLTYRGVSAHSAYPHLGRSAIEAAAEGVRALAGLRRELEGERLEASRHFPDAPFATLNVGTIRGGAAVNVVPDRCVLEVGVRLLPGMEVDAVAERVRTAVGDGPELEVQSLSPPLSAPADAPVVRELLELPGQAEAGAVSYATDAGWLAHLGLDCAVFGPGSIEVAHKPNESIPKADLARAREVLEALIDRF